MRIRKESGDWKSVQVGANGENDLGLTSFRSRCPLPPSDPVRCGFLDPLGW